MKSLIWQIISFCADFNLEFVPNEIQSVQNNSISLCLFAIHYNKQFCGFNLIQDDPISWVIFLKSTFTFCLPHYNRVSWFLKQLYQNNYYFWRINRHSAVNLKIYKLTYTSAEKVFRHSYRKQTFMKTWSRRKMLKWF